jgi:hypothetical protein
VYEEVSKLEDKALGKAKNRLFYFAIPPSVFAETAGALAAVGRSDSGWNRCMSATSMMHDASALVACRLRLHSSSLAAH